jgi:hypothetical protein
MQKNENMGTLLDIRLKFVFLKLPVLRIFSECCDLISNYTNQKMIIFFIRFVYLFQPVHPPSYLLTPFSYNSFSVINNCFGWQ